MLEVSIVKKYENFTLDVDLKTHTKFFGLLGASGSGKSLTLKAIAGIVTPDSGRIAIGDRVLFDSELGINLKVQDRRVGYLFQDYALFPNMTVLENIKVGSRTDDARVEEVIKELHIENIVNNYPHQISGGQKQRVALGRIIVNEPDIILLDEPFSALDEYLKWKIEIDVKTWLEHYNIPAVLVTHDKNESYRICDEISILEDGKTVECQVTNKLFTNPKTLAAAKILGIKNFSEIYLEGDNYYSKDWDYYFDTKETGDIIGVGRDNWSIVNGDGIDVVIDNIIEDESALVVLSKVCTTSAIITFQLDKSYINILKIGDKITISPVNILYLNK